MKKIFPLILSLIVLSACGSAQTNISEKEDLFRVGKTTVSSQDLFETMKHTDKASLVLQDAKERIAEEIEVNKDMKKEAQEQIDMFKDIFGDDFEKTLQQIGMKDEKEYLEKLVYPELRFNALLEKYVEENFDDLYEKHPAKKAQVLEVDPKKADEALALAKKEGIEKAAEKYLVENSPFDGQEQIFYLAEDGQIPAAVMTHLRDKEENGLSDVVKNESTETTYLVNMIASNSKEMKETLIKQYGHNQEIKEEITQEIFKKHQFKVYDQTVYDHLLEHFPSYVEE